MSSSSSAFLRISRHAAPVAEDHGDGSQRCAQLVCGAGGQQTHAHDQVFFRGLLLESGEARIAVAHVARDADQEERQQRRVEHEADERADDVQREQIRRVRRA